MRAQQFYYVYITVSSSRRAMYVGMTDDLQHRLWQHKKLKQSTFVGRYRATRLVYYETFSLVSNAIAREKEIKGWTRAKKDELVRAANPRWEDLAEDWGKQYQPSPEAVERLRCAMQDQEQPQGPSAAKSAPPQDDSE